MSEKLEIKTVNSKTILLSAVSEVKIQKIYKTRMDNSYVDVYNSSFSMVDSSIRINIDGFTSLIVIYDKTTNTSSLTFKRGEFSYKSKYKMTLFKDNIHGASSIITDIKNTSGINISANVSIVPENGDVLTYDYIISGEYALSDIKKDYSSYNNSLVIHDVSNNISSYAYVPNMFYQNDTVKAVGGVVSVKNDIKYSVFITIYFFTTNGLSIDDSPIIKMVGIKKHEE